MRCLESRYKIIFLILLTFFTVSCNDKKVNRDSKVIKIESQQYTPKMSFSGVIRPSCYDVVISPAEGHVSNIFIPYGKLVTKGESLLELSDVNINKEYITDVVSFLENKEKLRKAKEKLAGEQELFKAGVVSRNELEDDQYKYDAAQIDFIRSTLSLQKKSLLFAIDFKKIEQLTLHDLKQIKAAISKSFSVKVKSKFIGRWLSPLILDKRSNMDLAASYVGKKIEKGEIVGIVVKESCGVAVKLFVNQEEVRLIKPGMNVNVLGKIFASNNVLQGKVVDVGYFNVKTSDKDDSELLFPVDIVISNIPQQMKFLGLFGMKVQVVFLMDAITQIRVPIKAITVKDKQFYVTKLLPEGNSKQIEVKLGIASLQDVEVISGLSVGDKVVIND